MAKKSSVHSEVVEAEGHLIDSQILNVVFDTVVKHSASFDVLKFNIGRSNDEPSSISMRISAPTEQTLGQVLEELVALGCRLADKHDVQLRSADRDGCVPDDFYSTTNHRTMVRLDGQWVDVDRQRMDAVIVVDDSWMKRTLPAMIAGVPSRIISVEDLLGSKLFVVRRERFDVLHMHEPMTPVICPVVTSNVSPTGSPLA